MTTVTGPNNLTHLRNLCAAAVLVGHFYFLGVPPAVLETMNSYPWADLGVHAFFVISGMLVTMSFAAGSGIASYFARRIFRIYPLYALVILLQAAVMSLILLSEGRLVVSDLLSYLGWNGLFLNFLAPEMGGLFGGLNHPAINPSLWTLKLEVLFYCSVPLLHAGYRRLGPLWLLGLFAASTIFYAATVDEHAVLARQLPGQLRFFVVGMAIAYSWDRLAGLQQPRRSVSVALLVAAVLLAALVHKSDLAVEPVVQPLLVGAIVFLFGFWLPPLPSIQDLSYGVYLFHAPLVQLALLFGVYERTPAALVTLAGAVVVLAWCSHRLIERPAINSGKRFAAAIRRRPLVAFRPGSRASAAQLRDFPS